MKKKLLVCVGALVAAQLLSGCYVLRELSWDKDKVPAGEKSTATLGLQGTGSTVMARGGSSDEGRFFLVVTGESSGDLTFKRPTFDSKDQTGQKEKLVEDQDLLNLAFDQGSCASAVPFRQGGPPGLLWRTEGDAEETSKIIEAKLKAKAATDAEEGGFGGLILSGYWIDDGDDVVEDPASSDDDIGCVGVMTTTLLVKGAPLR